MLTNRQRDIVAAALRSVIDEVVSEHYDAETQEHQLTSRLAALLEKELRSISVLGKRVVVITQEFPDKGPGSLEKATGVDLYIGFMDLDRKGFSKGLFMQAKWHKVQRPTAEAKDLNNQCEKMMGISDESYVWLYGPEGVEVVRAQDVVRQSDTRPERLPSRKTDEVFRKVMECTEGDPRWGPDRVMALNGEGRRSVTAIMEELRIKTAVAVVMGDEFIDSLP